MQCKDFMRRPVAFVKHGETVAVAARQMRDSNVGFLPVCDSAGRVLGVLTDRDIAVRVCAEDLSPTRTRVEEVMSEEIVACRPTDNLGDAEERMSAEQKSRILIVSDDGHALGVISLSDIAAALDPRAAETLRDVSEREVLGAGGHKARPPS